MAYATFPATTALRCAPLSTQICLMGRCILPRDGQSTDDQCALRGAGLHGGLWGCHGVHPPGTCPLPHSSAPCSAQDVDDQPKSFPGGPRVVKPEEYESDPAIKELLAKMKREEQMKEKLKKGRPVAPNTTGMPHGLRAPAQREGEGGEGRRDAGGFQVQRTVRMIVGTVVLERRMPSCCTHALSGPAAWPLPVPKGFDRYAHKCTSSPLSLAGGCGSLWPPGQGSGLPPRGFHAHGHHCSPYPP